MSKISDNLSLYTLGKQVQFMTQHPYSISLPANSWNNNKQTVDVTEYIQSFYGIDINNTTAIYATISCYSVNYISAIANAKIVVECDDYPNNIVLQFTCNGTKPNINIFLDLTLTNYITDSNKPGFFLHCDFPYSMEEIHEALSIAEAFKNRTSETPVLQNDFTLNLTSEGEIITVPSGITASAWYCYNLSYICGEDTKVIIQPYLNKRVQYYNIKCSNEYDIAIFGFGTGNTPGIVANNSSYFCFKNIQFTTEGTVFFIQCTNTSSMTERHHIVIECDNCIFSSESGGSMGDTMGLIYFETPENASIQICIKFNNCMFKNGLKLLGSYSNAGGNSGIINYEVTNCKIDNGLSFTSIAEGNLNYVGGIFNNNYISNLNDVVWNEQYVKHWNNPSVNN